jgi:murein DD-endopeptidase MepM/ murein hydrolase activator NlpD
MRLILGNWFFNGRILFFFLALTVLPTWAQSEPEILADNALDIQTLSLPGYSPYFDMYYNWDTNNIDVYKFDMRNLSQSIPLILLYSDCEFTKPIEGKINSKFGWRGGRVHAGIDFQLSVGDTVYNAFDGVVRLSKYHGGYGNCVIVRHHNGLETLYGHFSKRLVKSGDLVNAGQVLGLGGSTGRSTGPHLHFETRYLGRPINPSYLIDFEADTLVSNFIVLSKESFNVPGVKKKHRGRGKTYKRKKRRKKSRNRRAVSIELGTLPEKLLKNTTAEV